MWNELNTKAKIEKLRNKRRHIDFRKAIRKKKLSDGWMLVHTGRSFYGNLHEYSKNKIHCSCDMCRTKTNNKHRNTFESHHNYSVSDTRKIDKLDYEDI